MARGFTDLSTTGVLGTGYRIATKRNKSKWQYDSPGFVPGTVFGGAHQTGQTCRPAAYLPIRELNKQTDMHVTQYPIVLYGGTIVALEADDTAADVALSTVEGGSSTDDGGVSIPARYVAVPANGGYHSLTEAALSAYDVEHGTRLKGSAALVTTETNRVALLPNYATGVVMKNGYQNMADLYQNFDPQEVGLDLLLHGWAHYPYSNKNIGGTDAAWSVKQVITDADVTSTSTAYQAVSWTQLDGTATAGGSAEDVGIINVAGMGKLIVDGPLAQNIIVEIDVDSGTSWEDITGLIDWEATRKAAFNSTLECSQIWLYAGTDALGGGLQDLANVDQTRVTGNWARTATVTAVDLTGNTITVDDIAFMGGAVNLVDNDIIVDGEGLKHQVAAAGTTANVISVDTDLVATTSTQVGSRVTVHRDGAVLVGQRAPEGRLKSGDDFQSGLLGQVVKWTAGVDDPVQKLGKVFWVEPAGTYARHAGELIQNVPDLDLVGLQTGGLPAHIFDEFGNDADTAQGMWVNFGVK